MIIIGGPTASGKTAVASAVAKKLNTGIISADSMQIYKGFDIGTAKEKDEALGVKQYCVDIADPKQAYTVVDYRENAQKAAEIIENGGKIPVVAGGTGFYIDSLIYPLDYGSVSDPEIMAELKKELSEKGADFLYDRLKELDPSSAEKIHKNNTRRLLRALEVIAVTKKPFSAQNTKKEPVRDYKMFILLPSSRATLYERIERRVDKMIAAGLKDEVSGLLESGLDFSFQAMQGIGYKEWKGYFDGAASLEDTAELIKKNTRAYAKRQETWFKNQYPNAVKIIFDGKDPETVAGEICKVL